MSNKVILVVIDGLGFQTAVEHCGYLESLVVGGKARRWTMETVLPSLSVPIYETLHSGTDPHDHGPLLVEQVGEAREEHVLRSRQRPQQPEMQARRGDHERDAEARDEPRHGAGRRSSKNQVVSAAK